MTDDQILAAAERIKARRLNEKRLESFNTKEEVMIRWDNIGTQFGESYTSVGTMTDAVREIVTEHYKELMDV